MRALSSSFHVNIFYCFLTVNVILCVHKGYSVTSMQYFTLNYRVFVKQRETFCCFKSCTVTENRQEFKAFFSVSSHEAFFFF